MRRRVRVAALAEADRDTRLCCVVCVLALPKCNEQWTLSWLAAFAFRFQIHSHFGLFSPLAASNSIPVPFGRDDVSRALTASQSSARSICSSPIRLYLGTCTTTTTIVICAQSKPLPNVFTDWLIAYCTTPSTDDHRHYIGQWQLNPTTSQLCTIVIYWSEFNSILQLHLIVIAFLFSSNVHTNLFPLPTVFHCIHLILKQTKSETICFISLDK